MLPLLVQQGTNYGGLQIHIKTIGKYFAVTFTIKGPTMVDSTLYFYSLEKLFAYSLMIYQLFRMDFPDFNTYMDVVLIFIYVLETGEQSTNRLLKMLREILINNHGLGKLTHGWSESVKEKD